MEKNPIILALDTTDLAQAISTADSLRKFVGHFKVGLELLTAHGIPNVIRAFSEKQLPLFVDVKYSDIPNTIRRATRELSKARVSFFDVHANAGIESMRAAAQEKGGAKLLAVTVLTSIASDECLSIYAKEPGPKVLEFAKMAAKAGADGIVCSPQELQLLKGDFSLNSLLRVTPGVRPSWANANDQKRVMTPCEAIKHGAHYLVIGRPILQPPKGMTPIEAAQKILGEVEGMK